MNNEKVFKVSKIRYDYNISKVNYGDLGLIGYSRDRIKRENGENVSTPLMVLLFLLLTLLTFKVILRGIDNGIERKDRMLCESAKISGNKEYLEKCECFYQGEDIRCLQK